MLHILTARTGGNHIGAGPHKAFSVHAGVTVAVGTVNQVGSFSTESDGMRRKPTPENLSKESTVMMNMVNGVRVVSTRVDIFHRWHFTDRCNWNPMVMVWFKGRWRKVLSLTPYTSDNRKYRLAVEAKSPGHRMVRLIQGGTMLHFATAPQGTPKTSLKHLYASNPTIDNVRW